VNTDGRAFTRVHRAVDRSVRACPLIRIEYRDFAHLAHATVLSLQGEDVIDPKRRRHTTRGPGPLDFDFHNIAYNAHCVRRDVLRGWIPGDVTGLDVEA